MYLKSLEVNREQPRNKQKSQAKTARIPIKIEPFETLKKPDWIRV